MDTMPVGLVDGPRTLTLHALPVPRPTPETLVVDIAFCGICGTDVHAFESGRLLSKAVCGHEWAGTVSAVGSSVTSVSEGDRVVVAVPPACGRCDPCRAGHVDYCMEVFLTQLGADPLASPHGGFAPSLLVGPGRVIGTAPELSDVEAAQVEPATVTFHAVARSGLRLGDTVVVQGGGPIGLLTLQWARAAGAGHVIVIEPAEHRQTLATSLGADRAVAPGPEAEALILEASGGLGADVVYECVGRPETVQSAVDLVRRGGSVCLIGLASGDVSITPTSWLIKEVKVTAALAYLRDEFETVMGLVADGRVALEPMHDHTIGLEDLATTLDDLAEGRSAHTKILVDPRS